VPLEPAAHRPDMAAGYGIHARRDGLLPWSEVGERMEQSRSYWVCSVRPDGRPHAMPVWAVWIDETLWFSTGQESVKARNLAANPAVVVHLESGDDAVIFEGTAERVAEPDRALFKRIAEAYDAKYDHRPGYPGPGETWYALRATKVFAWHERDYPRSATRWRPAAG
jgi:PPOX class probable F420-dependent enzyme